MADSKLNPSKAAPKAQENKQATETAPADPRIDQADGATVADRKTDPGSHDQGGEYVDGAEHVIGTDPRRVPQDVGQCMYDGHRVVDGKHVDPMGVELNITHKGGPDKGIVPINWPGDLTERDRDDNTGKTGA
jgi:hypothetical protein